MSRLTRDGTAEPFSRDQILRREQGQGNIHFPCLADHVQNWQPSRLVLTLAICDDHTDMHASRQPHVLLPFSLFFGDDAFSEYFCTITVFSLREEYVARFPLPDGVFSTL